MPDHILIVVAGVSTVHIYAHPLIDWYLWTTCMYKMYMKVQYTS